MPRKCFGQENELTFKNRPRGGHRPWCAIVNRKTGELVQEIPNEQVLRMAEESKRR